MKKAFTMLELIMVIVIIGILAAVIIPRTGSNKTAEAAIQLISHIRYTQHLAMVDDKFDSTINWYQNLWQIRFDGTGSSYSIVSDNNPALDPLNKTNMQDINISNDYDVTLSFSNNCDNNKTISFDHMGRPMVDDISTIATAYTNLLTTNSCDITLTGNSAGDTVVINIEPETGYAHIP